MISRITGILESVEATKALVVQRFGDDCETAFEVLVPGYLALRLQQSIGRRIVLTTLEHLEGQGQGTSFIPRLIGFGSVQERDFFELMRTVKGLGTRKALRALAEEPSVIACVIAEQDTKSLQKLPEIGKRMAEIIVVDLKDKMGPYILGTQIEPKGQVIGGVNALSPEASEAVEALISLGETRTDAERLVERALRRAGPEGSGTAEGILAAALGAR